MGRKLTFLLVMIGVCIFAAPKMASAYVTITEPKDYSTRIEGEWFAIKFKDDKVKPNENGQYNVAIKYSDGTWKVRRNMFVYKPPQGLLDFTRDEDIQMLISSSLDEGKYGAPAEIRVRNLKDDSSSSVKIIIKSKKAKKYTIKYKYSTTGKTYALNLVVPLDVYDSQSKRIERFKYLAEALNTTYTVKDVTLDPKQVNKYKITFRDIQRSIDSFSSKTEVPRSALEIALGKFSISLTNTALSANSFCLASVDAAEYDKVAKILSLALAEVNAEDKDSGYSGSLLDVLHSNGGTTINWYMDALLAGIGDVVVESYPGSRQYASIGFALDWNMRMRLIQNGLGLIPTTSLASMFL